MQITHTYRVLSAQKSRQSFCLPGPLSTTNTPTQSEKRLHTQYSFTLSFILGSHYVSLKHSKCFILPVKAYEFEDYAFFFPTKFTDLV